MFGFMEFIVILLISTLFIGLIVLLIYMFFVVVIETIEFNYIKVFKKPLYVHFYLNLQKLSAQEQMILRQFSFYNRLTPKRKKYFEHRVCRFLSHYSFVARDGVILTPEVRVSIAATAIKLTFGMRTYLLKVFSTIVVYPQAYYSTINDTMHKGEFNPRMKAVVFSWEDFKLGLKNPHDNINLGLHEFTHALHFHGLKYNDASAQVFAKMYEKMMHYLQRDDNARKIYESDYFRAYAFGNPYEFLAVLMEHFFESPEALKSKFPELYVKVHRMINFDS